MCKRHLVKTFKQMEAVILLTASIIAVGSLNCYREEPMPVIIDQIEDINSIKIVEQTIDKGQDTHSIHPLYENQMTELLSEPAKDVQE
jgi:cell fate (sporulation/competence/biofilm development) regulator YmcA (YheA/YmcA/DUF963 family)